MPTLLDATVLSNFAAVEGLDLLRHALTTAELAVTVYAEVQRGIRDGYEFLRAVEAHVSPLRGEGWARCSAQSVALSRHCRPGVGLPALQVLTLHLLRMPPQSARTSRATRPSARGSHEALAYQSRTPALLLLTQA